MTKPEEVISLNLSGKEFLVDGLPRFVSLQELDVSDTNFNRPDILARLQYLKVVNLTGTPLKDLSPVGHRIINGSLVVIGKDEEVARIYEISRIRVNSRGRIAIPRSPYKLRVLIFGLPLSILCGVTSVQKDLARVLLLAGHEVLMLNYFPIATKDFILNSCTLKDGDLNVELILANRDLDLVLKSMRSIKFFPDIVHAHTHTIQSRDMMDIILRELENPPLVFTIHDLLPYRQILVDHTADALFTGAVDKSAIERAIDLSYFSPNRTSGQLQMIKKADAVVCISEGHKKAVDSIFGVEIGRKTRVIKNTTPLWFVLNLPEVSRNAQSIREDLHKENNLVLFYSGRISKEKMIETLMLGFNKICEEYPTTKLLLIGVKNDSETASSLVNVYGLKEKFIGNVLPTGWIKDTKKYAAYFLSGDILVQPGRTLNLYSIAAIEAMAARKPVVSAPGELSCGVGDNPDNIYRSVSRIMENYAFYEKYCDGIYNKALDAYGPVRFLEEHLKLYTGLLEEKPRTVRLLRKGGRRQLANIGFLFDASRYEFRIRLDKLTTKTNDLPPIEGVDERNCSKYARLAAEKLFGLDYAQADAWDIGKMPGNYVVWRKNESKEDYHKAIKPGDLVGIYIRASPSNRRNRSYTHLALYLGEGKILHQFGKDVIISIFDRLLLNKHYSVLKEIIRTNRTSKENNGVIHNQTLEG